MISIKMTSFASDGPTVMLGKKNGVVTQLKKENDSVISVHCMNHRLQLAVSKTFTSIRKIDKTDELLKGLFKYYHYSTVKSGSLDALQTLLRDLNELDTSNNLVVTKAAHTRWLSHEKSFQTIRKLYVAITLDLENAVSEGRDKNIRDNSGIPASSLLKLMKSYESLYFIHFLCDVCGSVASLTRLFEKEDVDLSVIEPKLSSTIAVLEQMKNKDGPFLKKANGVAQNLKMQITQLDDLKKVKNEFLESLIKNIELRLENPEIITHLSALNLTLCSEESISYYGDSDVGFLAEHFKMDEEQTLMEWNEIKHIFKDEMENSTARHMLSTLTSKSPMLGDTFPNIKFLLSVCETLIISTAPVERIFSKVQLTFTQRRNRLNVETVNNLVLVSANTKSIEDLNISECVKLFLQKKRRICQ